MPRYIVERSFQAPSQVLVAVGEGDIFERLLQRNAETGITWLNSYVSEDKRHSFCVYDAPTPEAIRKGSARNELPVDRITRVRLLDPYFYN